jgi:hypothetical protein
MARMVRRLALLPGCALLLAACGGGGGGSSPATTARLGANPASLVTAGLEPPAGCYVTVLLVEDITRAQVEQVQNRLLATKAVEQVSFVSKSLEFQRFKQTNAKVAKGMHVNPFTDRFEVVPRSNSSVFSIVSDFATKGGPITNVRPSVGCSTTVG